MRQERATPNRNLSQEPPRQDAMISEELTNHRYPESEEEDTSLSEQVKPRRSNRLAGWVP